MKDSFRANKIVLALLFLFTITVILVIGYVSSVHTRFVLYNDVSMIRIVVPYLTLGIGYMGMYFYLRTIVDQFNLIRDIEKDAKKRERS